MVKKVDRCWEALAHKLELGCDLDVAAGLSGIPIDEALEWLKKKRLEPNPEADVETMTAGKAIQSAVEVLSDLLKDGCPTHKDETGEVVLGDEIRLQAAIALLNFGKSERSRIDRKRARADQLDAEVKKPGSLPVGADLFDAWIFKNGPGASRTLWQESRGALLERRLETEPQKPDLQ